MAQNPFGVSKLTEQQVKEIEDALKNSENYTLGGQGNGNAGPSDKELKDAATAAKKYAAAVDKMEGALGDILEPAEKYRLTMEEINRISEEASFKEAARNLGLSEAEAKTRLMTKATDEYKDAIEEANQETVRARNEMADFFAEGMQGWDSFRDAAVNALQDVLRNMLRVAMGGSAEDSIFGNIGGGLGGLISGGISSLFGGFDFTSQAGYKPGFYGPGFATGGSIMEDRATGGPDNQMVTLRKSRNERLTISRPGQKNMGQSGNAVTVQQNINVTTGVQQTVRAELARYMPQIKEQAVRAVDEAISRSVMRGS